MNQPPITRLIELIAPRLPIYKVVGKDVTYFTGSDLRLTGVKDFHGAPLEDDKAYSIVMPRIYYHNHEHKMRLAWLANGLTGVYDYLAPFLSEASLNKLRNQFMHVSENKITRGTAVLNN